MCPCLAWKSLWKLPTQWGLNCSSCVGEEAAAPSVRNPAALPDFCVCSPFAVYTCWCKPALRARRDISDSVPERKRRRGRRCRWWLQGQETRGPELCLFLLLSLKDDLTWSDPPRFIPETCHLHTTASAISAEQDVWKAVRNKKHGNFQFIPSRSWNRSLKVDFFFFFFFLSIENNQPGCDGWMGFDAQVQKESPH